MPLSCSQSLPLVPDVDLLVMVAVVLIEHAPFQINPSHAFSPALDAALHLSLSGIRESSSSWASLCKLPVCVNQKISMSHLELAYKFGTSGKASVPEVHLTVKFGKGPEGFLYTAQFH